MVMCLGQGADLHMTQLMPLPLTISCSSKFRLLLPFWWRHTQVVPHKIEEGRKTVVCACQTSLDLLFSVILNWVSSWLSIWTEVQMICICSTATHHLVSLKSRMVYLSGAGLPRLSWKTPLNGCSSSSSSVIVTYKR